MNSNIVALSLDKFDILQNANVLFEKNFINNVYSYSTYHPSGWFQIRNMWSTFTITCITVLKKHIAFSFVNLLLFTAVFKKRSDDPQNFCVLN